MALVISTPPKADTGSPASAASRILQLGPRCQTTGIIMFQNSSAAHFQNLIYQTYGSVNIQKIVVRNFLAVQLLKHFIKFAEKVTLDADFLRNEVLWLHRHYTGKRLHYRRRNNCGK